MSTPPGVPSGRQHTAPCEADCPSGNQARIGRIWSIVSLLSSTFETRLSAVGSFQIKEGGARETKCIRHHITGDTGP